MSSDISEEERQLQLQTKQDWFRENSMKVMHDQNGIDILLRIMLAPALTILKLVFAERQFLKIEKIEFKYPKAMLRITFSYWSRGTRMDTYDLVPAALADPEHWGAQYRMVKNSAEIRQLAFQHGTA